MKKHYFTLIEIMGVTALIVVLLLLGYGAYSYALDSSREKAAKADIVRIGNALSSLQDEGMLIKTFASAGDNGFVAVKIDISDKKIVFLEADDLSEFAELGDTSARREKIYRLFVRAMDMDNISSIIDDDGVFVDGWGQSILVRYPGKFNRGGFDIISAGSDGKFGEDESDLPPLDITKYRDNADNEWLCDDVTNF